MGYPKYSSIVRFFENATYGINMAVHGGNTAFTLTAPPSHLFKIWDIKFIFIAPWTGSTSNISYNKFMDQTALSNGITINDFREGDINFGATLKTNLDLITLPVSKWTIPFKDNQYTCVQIDFNFNPNTSILLDSRLNDRNEITIRDDLGFMKYFIGSARGEQFLY